MESEEDNDSAPVTMDLLLNMMDMQEHISYFQENGITTSILMGLQACQVPDIFPASKFSLGVRLSFVQKYTSFMEANNFPVHTSFLTMQKESDDACSVVSDANNANRETHKIDAGEDRDRTFIPDSDDSSSSSEETFQAKKPQLLEGEGNLKKDNQIPRPLVNRSKIGLKRKITKQVDEEVDELDLRDLLNDNPLSSAVLHHFQEKAILSDDDRSTILDVVVPWLLKRTEYPTRSHYEKLTEKICDIFKEEESIWYIPPKSEGEKQPYPKGKLADRVKNSKTKLRNKGFLPAARTKKRNSQELSVTPVDPTEEEMAAVTWLERNHEPFSDVQLHWGKCAKLRLRELFNNADLTPHAYITKWHEILKFPSSHKLILDDFKVLPDIDPKYNCIKGKENQILKTWPQFSQKIEQIYLGRDSGLEKQEKKQFKALFEAASCENSKDFVILQLLSFLCKHKGRVKVGNKCFKPSTEESKEAFVFHVPVAAEFDNFLRKKQERHQLLGAPLQPYICVIGEERSVVRACYVIVNQVPWKASSILNALDICFKACFSLNCGFPPEAEHLWLFVQKYLYDICFPDDRFITSVTTFIKKLEFQLG